MPYLMGQVNGYRDLAGLLRTDIENGTHRPGEQLPTEATMSARYGINRHTVRAALQLLELDGYIYRMRGKGTFVARRKIPYAISPATSFSGSVNKLGLKAGRRVIKGFRISADAELSKKLEISVGAEVAVLDILRSIDEVPACLTTSYMPGERFSGISEIGEELESLYGLMRDGYGVEGIHRVWSEIEAAMPEERDREILQMPANMPVLLTRSLAKDEDNKPVEYCVSRNRGDSYSLRVDMESICSMEKIITGKA